jgi:hypothetical protein
MTHLIICNSEYDSSAPLHDADRGFSLPYVRQLTMSLAYLYVRQIEARRETYHWWNGFSFIII